MKTFISMRDGINLLESAIFESTVDTTLAQVLASPLGELIGYTFADAQTPQELQRAIIGSATEIHTQAKSFGVDAISDNGITSLLELQQYLKFAKAVATNPQEYFDAYQQSQVPRLDAPVVESEQSDLESQLPHLDGDEKEQAEHDIIEFEAEKRQ